MVEFKVLLNFQIGQIDNLVVLALEQFFKCDYLFAVLEGVQTLKENIKVVLYYNTCHHVFE